jgi:hypothetical protein
MRSLASSRLLRTQVGALVAIALIIGTTATVAAKKPTPPPQQPPPPQPSPTITIAIAPTASLEPSGEYANIDVTVTCPLGWTFSQGWVYIFQPDDPGGSGTFGGTCTGTPQVGHSRVVNGNRINLGSADAQAFVRIAKDGTQVTASSSRTITVQPSVVVRIAAQGQLTGTSGGSVAIALSVACPIGAAGQASTVSVTQGSATGTASFTPTCDRFAHTVVASIAAAQGTFQTGSASASALASVGFSGGSFSGTDSRTVTILESSTGDKTPPTTPANLSANVFGDGETWLSWSASSDNATPSGLIVYEVFLNGRFDQGIGGGQTSAILYADLGVVSTIEVVAVDGAGNRSAPASVTVDCSQGWCQ